MWILKHFQVRSDEGKEKKQNDVDITHQLPLWGQLLIIAIAPFPITPSLNEYQPSFKVWLLLFL